MKAKRSGSEVNDFNQPHQRGKEKPIGGGFTTNSFVDDQSVKYLNSVRASAMLIDVMPVTDEHKLYLENIDENEGNEEEASHLQDDDDMLYV